MTTGVRLCKGTTLKGEPCKIKVANGEKYCRYHNKPHTHDNSPKKRNNTDHYVSGGWIPSYLNNPIVQPNPRRPGFLYIYTYKLLYDGICNNRTKDLKWLKIDNSVLSPDNTKKKIWQDMSNILCKIGMTTKRDVQSRLNEWESSCLHKVINLTPQNTDILIESSTNLHKSGSNHNLSKLMGKLSLSPKKQSQSRIPSCKDLKLYTYQNGGFYFDGKGSMTLQDIENSIHQLLWKKYGKGVIHCSGCKKTGTAYKKHIEWFVIPIKDLPLVLQLIDNFCLSQNR